MSVRSFQLTNYGDKKTIIFPKKSEGSRLDKGSFASVKGVRYDGSWVADEFMYCREYFQEESHGLRRMFYVCERHKSRHVTALISKVEDMIGVKPRSYMGPTQRNNIMWIMPSPWWVEAEMKRSLFTALLRLGEKYQPEEDNFESLLFGQEYGTFNLYTRTTEYAVRRFFKGYTRYMGSQDGWYHQFCCGGRWKRNPPSERQINKLLRKPDLSDKVGQNRPGLAGAILLKLYSIYLSPEQ